MSIKVKDGELVNEYLFRFRKPDGKMLIHRLVIIINNNFAKKAVNII